MSRWNKGWLNFTNVARAERAVKLRPIKHLGTDLKTLKPTTRPCDWVAIVSWSLIAVYTGIFLTIFFWEHLFK